MRPKDRILLGANTLGQSGPGNDGNEQVLWFLQSCNITGASTSDCLVSNQGHSWVCVWGGGVYLSARDAVGVFYIQSNTLATMQW